MDELRQLGFMELSYRNWVKPPRTEPATEYLTNMNHILDSQNASREVQGLTILLPERPINYYRGRWVIPKSETGRFVGRRSQAYGADLWCYVKLVNGLPDRLIDFPSVGSKWRGCDEAWRLQLAIDSQNGNPQQFRVCVGNDGSTIIKVFSPLPMWVVRRWNAVGTLLNLPGCLFAYRFPDAEVSEEIRFAVDDLWMKESAPTVND